MIEVGPLIEKLIKWGHVDIDRTFSIQRVDGWYKSLNEIKRRGRGHGECACIQILKFSYPKGRVIHGSCHSTTTDAYLRIDDIRERLLSRERLRLELTNSLLLFMSNPTHFIGDASSACVHFGVINDEDIS